MTNSTITVSAPGKIHLLGEHAVVYGKPALLATVDLRITVSITPVIASAAKQSSPIINPTQITSSTTSPRNDKLKKIIEPIVKKHLKIKSIPAYQLSISSQLPLGAGLGSSAAVSAAYIGALLSFLKVKWDLNLINGLAYEAEKVFHGNPSGADNSTIIFGRLVWYRKESPNLKLIQQLAYSIPAKLAKNFVIINTGTPKETTLDMVTMVKNLYQKKPALVEKFLDNQEKLVKDLLLTLKESNEKELKSVSSQASLIRIIRHGEKNLESIGVASRFAQNIIRNIEKTGGAAKICGAGGKTGPTGVLLCYHKDRDVLDKIAKSYALPFFTTTLGVEGLRKE